jgi:hypothetical protein
VKLKKWMQLILQPGKSAEYRRNTGARSKFYPSASGGALLKAGKPLACQQGITASPSRRATMKKAPGLRQGLEA